MPERRDRLLTQRLLALFGAGWLVLSFPLLRIWLGDATWFGWPLLPTALFASWAAIIGGLAWLMESRGGR
ncbi:MAG: hypothetical protein KGN16_07970 [Burkholderiales bacterium]|nr:hypothetical protein [Burkholderiales bacterium]